MNDRVETYLRSGWTELTFHPLPAIDLDGVHQRAAVLRRRRLTLGSGLAVTILLLGGAVTSLVDIEGALHDRSTAREVGDRDAILGTADECENPTWAEGTHIVRGRCIAAGGGNTHDHNVTGGPFNEERIKRENRETQEYMDCMTRRGWDLPEPTIWEGPPHPGLLDPPTDVPDDPQKADEHYRDSHACGVSFYDENNNLLPLRD